MTSHSLGGGRQLSTTVIWGMNLHHHAGASHLILHGGPDASPHHHSSSLLAEANLTVDASAQLFFRAERVEKSGEELGFLGGDLTELYDIRAISGGATRRVRSMRSIEMLVGGRAAVNVVPASVEATYGTRTPVGFFLYLQLRPTSAARVEH
ncbi:MAG: hypothetical protein ABIT91_13745 [Gemmatimonadaceae bacterium]